MRADSNSLYCNNLTGRNTDFRNINTRYSAIAHNNTNSNRNLRICKAAIYKRLIIASAIIVCLIIGIGCLMTVSASDLNNKNTLNRYYTSIEVHAEDTLWELADEYNNGEESRNQYIDSIKELNNMNSDTLYSGQNILMYYYSETVK